MHVVKLLQSEKLYLSIDRLNPNLIHVVSEKQLLLTNCFLLKVADADGFVVQLILVIVPLYVKFAKILMSAIGSAN